MELYTLITDWLILSIVSELSVKMNESPGHLLWIYESIWLKNEWITTMRCNCGYNLLLVLQYYHDPVIKVIIFFGWIWVFFFTHKRFPKILKPNWDIIKFCLYSHHFFFIASLFLQDIGNVFDVLGLVIVLATVNLTFLRLSFWYTLECCFFNINWR